MCLVKGKSAGQCFAGKNDTGRFPRLEESDELLDRGLIVTYYVQQGGAAIGNDENFSRGRGGFEFPCRLESGLLQGICDINRYANRGKTMVGRDQNIRGIQNTMTFQSFNDSAQVIVGISNSRQALGRARAGLMLRKIRLIHPKKREFRDALGPKWV